MKSSRIKKSKKKPKILMRTSLFPSLWEHFLLPWADIKVCSAKKTYLKYLKSCDILITLLTEKTSASLLQKAPQLKWIGNYAAGLDHIDLKMCQKKNIGVVYTPEVLTRSTAELALTLLLACARRVTEGVHFCKRGKFQGWKPDLLLGKDLFGKTAVLVGKGRIGMHTAKLFRALGLRILWITKKDSKKEIEQKLQKAQVLSLHIPLNQKTRYWLNQKRFSLLPQGAILINTARGALIEEHALIQALKQGNLFSAGLDVYEKEPQIPPALRALANVVLLPHVGSATFETRTQMAQVLFQGLEKAWKGKKPWNLALARKNP